MASWMSRALRWRALRDSRSAGASAGGCPAITARMVSAIRRVVGRVTAWPIAHLLSCAGDQSPEKRVRLLYLPHRRISPPDRKYPFRM